MTVAPEPVVFISYRRQDSSAAARWLSQVISRTFGPQSVFIDTDAIRMGDEWPDRINRALRSAKFLLPVIGPTWLRIADEDGRRRLDKKDDWVRNEIVHALTNKLHIIPLLLSHTPPLKKDALPQCLKKLPLYQAFELRDDRWESDLSLLLSQLEQLGVKRVVDRGVRYPTPRVTVKDLSREEISDALKTLPGWELVPGKEPLNRTELHQVYEFASFEDAMAFMSAAVPFIAKIDHHPRWENIWRSVSVWLTTWDIGHKPSQLDLDLAKHMEELRQTYPPAKPKPKAK